MINDFHTVLSNRTYAEDPAERVAPGYIEKQLIGEIAEAWDILYQNTYTREDVFFLTDQFEQLVYAANLGKFLLSKDPRKSYEIEPDKFFRFSCSHSLRVPNPNHKLAITGSYNFSTSARVRSQKIVGQQLPNIGGVPSPFMTFQLADSRQYVAATGFTQAQSEAAQFNFQSTTTHQLGNTGIAVTYICPEGFAAQGGKTIEFTVEAPYRFSSADLLTRMHESKRVFDIMISEADESELSGIWRDIGYTQLYKTAACIVATYLNVRSV